MSLRERHEAFKEVVQKYLEELRKRAEDPDATDEMSLRPALDILELTAGERKAVSEAVVELVWRRLEQARSV